MPHHALASPRRLVALLVAAVLAAAGAAGSLACGGDDDPTGDAVTSALRVVVSAAAPVRGVQIDLRHASTLTVMEVIAGSAFTGATCAANNDGAGRVQAGCVASSDLSAPFTAFTVMVQHAGSVEPADEVTALGCVVSDGSGAHVVATCALD